LININKAIAICEILNQNKRISKSLLTVSQIYYAQSRFDEAIQHSEQSITEKLEFDDTTTLEVNYLTVGAIYKENGDYAKSLEYFLFQ